MKAKAKNGLRKFKNLWRRLCLLGVNYDKLNLGSGKRILPGWLNIDIDASFGKEIFPLDLRNPFPFPDNSVSMIFIEHCIEHFNKNEGLNFLRECYRVLKNEGVIRIGFADLNKASAAYIKRSNSFRKGMLKHMGPNRTDSWEEFFSDWLYSWDRRYCYSMKLLAKYMSFASFKNVKEKKFGESEHGYVWDTRDDPDNTYLEAIKA